MTLYELAEKVNNNDYTEFYMKVKDNKDGTYYVLLQASSPAGEDLPEEFEIESVEELVKEMRRRSDDFDPDEHAEMWVPHRGKDGVPYSIRELINDADAIEEMYGKLAGVLEREAEL